MMVEITSEDKQISHASMLMKASNAKAYLVGNLQSYDFHQTRVQIIWITI